MRLSVYWGLLHKVGHFERYFLEVLDLVEAVPWGIVRGVLFREGIVLSQGLFRGYSWVPGRFFAS